MGKSGIERRIHPRLAMSLPVRISTIDPETDLVTQRPFFRASREWCANVSRGGLFIRTSEPFCAGRRVLVEMTLPDARSFHCVGRVAWIQRSLAADARGECAEAEGIGIEFLGAAPGDLAALDRHLRSAGRGSEHVQGYVV